MAKTGDNKIKFSDPLQLSPISAMTDKQHKSNQRPLLYLATFGTILVLAFCYIGIVTSASSTKLEGTQGNPGTKQETAFLKIDTNFVEDEIKDNATKNMDSEENGAFQLINQDWKNSIEGRILDLDHKFVLQSRETETELDFLDKFVTSLDKNQNQMLEKITSISENAKEFEIKNQLNIMSLSSNISSKLNFTLNKLTGIMILMEEKHTTVQAGINTLKNEMLQMKKELSRGGCSPSSFFLPRKAALTNLVIIGSHADGSPFYGCRAKVEGGNLIPGTFNIKQEACYMALHDREIFASTESNEIEVLTNSRNSDLIWKPVNPKNYNGQWFTNEGVVVGGKTSYGAPIFLVRCRHNHGRNNWSWIPGWVQSGSGSTPVYSFAGRQHSCPPWNVEALVCRSEPN